MAEVRYRKQQYGQYPDFWYPRSITIPRAAILPAPPFRVQLVPIEWTVP